MRRTIDVNVGVWDTEYRLTVHRDGSITIKAPYIHWHNNNGMLRHRSVRVRNIALANKVKEAFRDNTLFLSSYQAATLPDIVDGTLL